MKTFTKRFCARWVSSKQLLYLNRTVFLKPNQTKLTPNWTEIKKSVSHITICLGDQSCLFASESINSFQNTQFTSLVMDIQVENNMSLPAWWKYKKWIGCFCYYWSKTWALSVSFTLVFCKLLFSASVCCNFVYCNR